MNAVLRKLLFAAASMALFAGGCWAQTSSLEGDVKGEDGAPLKGVLVKIDRKDIKGAYKVKTDKKGHFFHAGLPLGMYKVTLEVDGKDVDTVDNVKTRLGDPLPVNSTAGVPGFVAWPEFARNVGPGLSPESDAGGRGAAAGVEGCL